MLKMSISLSTKKPTNPCCKYLQDKYILNMSSDSENPAGEILESWDHHLGKYHYMFSLFNSCILHVSHYWRQDPEVLVQTGLCSYIEP